MSPQGCLSDQLDMGSNTPCGIFEQSRVGFVCDLVDRKTSVHNFAVSVDEEITCFHAALVRPTVGFPSSGPSLEVWAGTWGEAGWLRGIFDAAFGGTCIRPDGTRKVMVDAGANIGLYGLYFAMQGCEVHAFEPLHVNIDHIRVSVRLNHLSDRMHIHHMAATDAEGNVTMRYSRYDTGLTHLVKPGETSRLNSTNWYASGHHHGHVLATAMEWREHPGVRAARIDTVLTHELLRGRPIEWLKVDVEGHERLALCGASALFARGDVRWVGFELNYETTSNRDALRIRDFLDANRMTHRNLKALGKIGAWQWDRYLQRKRRGGRDKGYMVTYERNGSFGMYGQHVDAEAIADACRP